MKNNVNNLTQYVLKERKGRPFIQIDTDVINGKIRNLSSDAKSEHTTLLSLPSEWDLYITWLNKITGLSRGRSEKARKELIEKGFLEKKEIIRNGKKAFEYIVYEIPKDVADAENLTLEIKGQNSDAGDEVSEKRHYINKYNKEKNINKKNKYNKKSSLDFSKSEGNTSTCKLDKSLKNYNNEELALDENGNPLEF